MPHRLLQDGELVLYGPVGFVDFWDESGFTAAEVLAALTEVDGDLTVRLNSGGGFAFDGVAIFNALKAHDGAVTVEIDALAASAASIIAMAGEAIVMREGALMMIHNASGLTFGTKAEHQKQIDVLSRLDGQMAGLYARRTGHDRDEIAALMDAETWMTGEEALEAGFATSAIDAEAEAPTAFAYQVYAHAPPRLVAQAERQAIRPDDFRRLVAATTLLPDPKRSGVHPKEEASMSDDPKPAGDALAEMTARAEWAEARLASLEADLAAAAKAPPASAADNAAVMRMCMEAGEPGLAAGLVERGVKPAAAKAAVGRAREIRAAVKLAHDTCPAIELSLADGYIAADTSVEAVRAALFDKLAAAKPAADISARHQPFSFVPGPAVREPGSLTAGMKRLLAKQEG